MQNNSTITPQMETGGQLAASARNIASNGLQQYYTPPPLAALIARVLRSQDQSFSVLDLTAGAGNLLRPFRNYKHVTACGVEIDRTQARHELGVHVADARLVPPFFAELGVEFNFAVLNPPFGLQWDYAGKLHNSAALTVRLALDLLDHGEGVVICDERNWPDIEPLFTDRPGGYNEEFFVYAKYSISGLFAPASACKVAVAFFVSEYKLPHRFDRDNPLTGEKSFGEFAHWAPEVEAALLNLRRTFDPVRNSQPLDLERCFAACCQAARSAAETENQTYTLELRGRQLRCRPTDYQTLLISRKHGEGWLRRIRRWSGLSLKYFALNSLELDQIRAALDAGMITVQPGLLDQIAAAIAASTKFTAPFYPLKPTQRLGYLEKLDAIKCIQSDPEHKFTAGESYPIEIKTDVSLESGWRLVSSVRDRMTCDEKRSVQTQRKYLKIYINNQRFDESEESIAYITDHFDVPDPTDVAAHHPALYAKYHTALNRLQQRFHFRRFQHDDLARLCCRAGAILSWEQGLGKMLGGISWALARGYKRVLIVCPQDLIPQWTAEAKQKFGIHLRRITSPLQARAIAARPKPAAGEPEEFFIVHFEALARNKSTCEELPASEWKRVITYETYNGACSSVIEQGTSEHCPHCRHSFAWNGGRCDPRKSTQIEDHAVRGCGYVHYRRRVHNMAHWLKNTFSAIIVDEGTKIKGDTSQIGRAVRTLRAKGRLILTGTPIKNFLHDSYWLLWWAAGGSVSASFPYGYGDKQRFLEDFCVLQWDVPQEANGYRRGTKKVLPEISNLSMLYKTLAPNILRRRKSETDEDLVHKRIVPVRVPFGTDQENTYAWWLRNFGAWYVSRPDVTMESENLAQTMGGILGQLWKLRKSASLPADPTLAEYDGCRGSSNHTPKLLACLQLIRQALEAREPVVVFNTMRAASQLLAAELQRAGVACRVCDGETAPAARAAAIQEFKAGKFQVLLAGLEAINLGHNLEIARRCIIYSLPFDLGGFDQAINRVHRLTSTHDVIVHVLLTRGSIDEKMWQLVEAKGRAAGLALDGQLGFDEVEELDWKQFAHKLQTEFQYGETIGECDITAQIAQLWAGLHLLNDPSGQRGAAAGLLDTFAFRSRRGQLSPAPA